MTRYCSSGFWTTHMLHPIVTFDTLLDCAGPQLSQMTTPRLSLSGSLFVVVGEPHPHSQCRGQITQFFFVGVSLFSSSSALIQCKFHCRVKELQDHVFVSVSIPSKSVVLAVNHPVSAGENMFLRVLLVCCFIN